MLLLHKNHLIQIQVQHQEVVVDLVINLVLQVRLQVHQDHLVHLQDPLVQDLDQVQDHLHHLEVVVVNKQLIINNKNNKHYGIL